MNEALQFHEDTFYEYFLPYRHPNANDDIWGGIGLETYGEDFKLVKSLDWNCVWTVIDGSNNPHQWITPGIRQFNHVCYLITKVPHNDLPAEFMIPNRFRSLTPLGLKRQLNKLNKAMICLNSNQIDV
ncbi:MAG: hypothetical protein PSV17_05585 [Methylotenera sp.]|uniref:hypothetical protein n=1 Tax=Methylotenera sp. TaxID=2051956 RepID=UPI0024891DF5|nr:hypothetical protein [Methylotenera sp.]MDI1308889.1 hypothetical protein [Methylotenera sp.]